MAVARYLLLTLLCMLLSVSCKDTGPVNPYVFKDYRLAIAQRTNWQNIPGVYWDRVVVLEASALDFLPVAENLNLSDSTISWTHDGSKLVFCSDWRVFAVERNASGLTPLTSESSRSANAVCSPFGPYVVFQSDRDGHWEIYSMSVYGDFQTRLTNSSVGAVDPSWKSDGQKIVYAGGDGLHVMDFDGSNDTRITTSSADRKPQWAPRGDKILFQSARDGNEEIYITDESGSQTLNLSNDLGEDMNPCWSPDAREIALISKRDHPFTPDPEQPWVHDWNHEIYIVFPDGTNLKRLTTDGQSVLIAWCPDGFTIASFHSGFVSSVSGEILQPWRTLGNVSAMGWFRERLP